MNCNDWTSEEGVVTSNQKDFIEEVDFELNLEGWVGFERQRVQSE